MSLAAAPYLFSFDPPGLIFILLTLLGTAFWIWMIVDFASKQRVRGNGTGWLLVLVLLGLPGALLYFFFRKLPGKSEAAGPPPLPGAKTGPRDWMGNPRVSLTTAQKPNQPPGPTPTAVTAPAGQEPRQP
jgi:hypothetical protein